MAATTPPLPPEPPSAPPPSAPPAAGGPQPPAAAPIPWEQPGFPALEGLYETAKLFLTRPSEAFARMPVTGDLGRSLLYAVIFGWIGIIASQAYNIALRGAMWSMLPGFNRGAAFALPIAVNIGVMILAPIFVLIGVFIWAAIVHLFLMLVGGANSGFAATVRVLCYAGTVQVLQVVPLCGGLIAGVWALVLEIIGLAIAHRTTQGKAALAVLLPIALCCVCAGVLMLAFGAAIWAAIAAHAR